MKCPIDERGAKRGSGQVPSNTTLWSALIHIQVLLAVAHDVEAITSTSSLFGLLDPVWHAVFVSGGLSNISLAARVHPLAGAGHG